MLGWMKHKLESRLVGEISITSDVQVTPPPPNYGPDLVTQPRLTATSLGSILKSSDITLPTKVHLVKAMVFPVVVYGCESWTIKKAEC